MAARVLKRVRVVLVGGGVLAVLCAGVWLLHRPASKPKTAPVAVQPTHVVHYSTPTPSETPATVKTYHSTATGNEPAYIKLPTIHAEGYVQAVGVDQNGAMAAPNNVTLAGWYVNTLAPGQGGLSVIDGHVDGKTSPGIFYNLHKLIAGDSLEVDLANGQVVQYVVKSVQQVAASDAAAALFARDNNIASQLNLITCGGTFSRAAGAYDDRVIVVAARST